MDETSKSAVVVEGARANARGGGDFNSLIRRRRRRRRRDDDDWQNNCPAMTSEDARASELLARMDGWGGRESRRRLKRTLSRVTLDPMFQVDHSFVHSESVWPLNR